jgi:hypothetical protein
MFALPNPYYLFGAEDFLAPGSKRVLVPVFASAAPSPISDSPKNAKTRS